MKKLIFMLLIGMIGISPAEARKKVKRGPASEKLSRVHNAQAKAPPPKPAQTSPQQATAVRKIGVAIFPAENGAPTGYNAAASAKLCDGLTEALNKKSYFKSTCLKEKISFKGSEAVLASLGKKRDVDAILVGSLAGTTVSMRLVRAGSGREIANFKATIPAKYDAGEVEDAASEAIVDGTPFRGFVTEVNDDVVEINVGSSHGIEQGMLLKVFEFRGENPSFQSGLDKRGVIQVTMVIDADHSLASIQESSGTIVPGTKVAVENLEAPTIEATTQGFGEGFWVGVGAEMLNISTTVNSTVYNDRKYNMKSTPFAQIVLGGKKLSAEISYGTAENPSEQLTYTSVKAAYQILSFGEYRQGTTVSVGGWLSQYSTTAKDTSIVAKLRDVARYSPYVEAKYQFVPGERLKLYVSGEVYYPIISSEQLSEMIPFSYGLGVVPAARYAISNGFAVEAGAVARYFVLPIAGDAGSRELQTGYFLRALAVF